ncbi:MAG: diguanylate cyclase (GGDEF)-like protein [Candidatus Aldehydirespiratoraceae bacterium]|jgi:diguanylate cyclase (GGDEF)-like protein
MSPVPPLWIERLIYFGRPRREIHGIEDTGRLRRLHVAALLFWSIGSVPFASVVVNEEASTALAIAIYAAMGPVLGVSLLIATKVDRLLGITPLAAIVWVLMLGNVSEFYLQSASMVAIVLGATFVAWMGTEVAVPYTIAIVGGVLATGWLAGDVYLIDRVALVALAAAFIVSVLGRQSDEIRQMAEDREVLLARLAHEIRHDNLTGLGNRAHLVDELSFALADSTVSSVGLALVDLDHFKAINDTHGHLIGDAVLIELGERLSAACGSGQTAVRIGGDEFAIIFRDPIESADHLVDRIEAAASWSFTHNGPDITVGASVGASVLPCNTATLERLFSSADHAMYERKAVRHRASESA